MTLKVNFDDATVSKSIQVEQGWQVHDAIKFIYSKFTDVSYIGRTEMKEFGLFLASTEDPKTGVWLEPGRTLDYYMLGDGDTIYFKRKLRILKVRTLDGTVKTLQVDDSQTTGNLMVVICTKLGITNHDEYSLIRESAEEEVVDNRPQFGTLTLRRRREDKDRDIDGAAQEEATH